MKRRIAVAAASICYALCLLVGVGCKDENPEIDFPRSNVSYGEHVQPLFDQRCNDANCHGQGTHQSLLDLTSYNNLVSYRPPVVTPGDSASSELYKRIVGRGPLMPSVGEPLTRNQTDGIGTWIQEGARNN